MIAGPIDGLYDWINSNPAPVTTEEAFDCVVLALEITGQVASAKVRETHEGVVIDYFHIKAWGAMVDRQQTVGHGIGPDSLLRFPPISDFRHARRIRLVPGLLFTAPDR
jgi:hypothetical protein